VFALERAGLKMILPSLSLSFLIDDRRQILLSRSVMQGQPIGARTIY
jgi:hypothetical protein